MPKIEIGDFVAKFDDFATWTPTKQVDYLVYYLTTDGGRQSVTGKIVADTLQLLDLREYKRLAQYLSESASDRNGKYLKASSGGYRLVRGTFVEIDRHAKNEPAKIAVSTELTKLVDAVVDSREKEFLEEAIDCYRIQSHRAAVILFWIVAIDHLQKYIFINHLAAFNVALAKNPDRKVSKIVNYDDFSDLPENKFIELARAAGVISNDVRKLLEEKLGTRNSAAHPSSVTISGHKATEFGLDIIGNVLLKYN